MIGYQLSREAAAREARWEASRERKDIMPWRGGVASTENGANFVTNQITVADAADYLARRGNCAIGLSATWACVRLLAGTIGSLPLMVYRTINGVREVARDHPLYFVLHESPNFDQSSADFWEYQSGAIELHGNAYAEIEKRQDGTVYALTPLRPASVRPRRGSGGMIEYEVTSDAQRSIRPARSILHVRGPMGDALSGASVLSTCGSAFSSAMHADALAATVFQNGARPSGVLGTDKLLTKPQREEIEALLHEKFVGAINAGRPMLLDNGLSWTQLTMKPEDIEMLESRRFSVEEIARLFGVPPHMIGHTDKATSWGTGLEQQTLAFVKFSLRQRLTRIEQALRKQLLTARDRAEGITIEFNLEGLLRGDSANRSNFYQSGLTNGWLTINEVRRLENLPPVPGGDVPRMQMQNVPLDAAPMAGGSA